ncbi:MAG TPA: J domain-containing protein [Bryobacteraceae bacterium]|nr:J domain-containing protein [Bryobacteraceae bacterium]
MQDIREDVRRPKAAKYTLSWRSRDGMPCTADAKGLDISDSGVGVESTREIPLDAIVQLLGGDGALIGECFVVHCTRRGLRFHIGLEFSEKNKKQAGTNAKTNDSDVDYYDVLQISIKADLETVHRVFRIMAARFHPDNPETGDPEEFLRLKRAYDVLSDPVRRMEYDALRESRQTEPLPIFELKDFVTGVEAESNRRLGVLSLLYNQRRTDPDHPAISLLNLESWMGFPREYLTFTMWYLRAKEYVSMADNSDYVLTASGVDHVESNAAQSEIVAKLLKSGGMRPHAKQAATPRSEGSHRLAPRSLPPPSMVR